MNFLLFKYDKHLYMYTGHELDINSYLQAQNVKEIQVRRENFAVPTLPVHLYLDPHNQQKVTS